MPPAAAPVQFAVISRRHKTTLTDAGNSALSPDGRRSPSSSSTAGKNAALDPAARRLDAAPCRARRGASYPFWSPDSRCVGFFANGKLKKIQAGGGAPIVWCDAPSGRRRRLGSRQRIVFASAPLSSRCMKVVAGGGEVTPATTLEATTVASLADFPPDGRHFLFVAASGREQGEPHESARRTSARRQCIAATNVGYSAGHLLFVRGRTLMAQPFDAVRLRSTGRCIPGVRKHPGGYGSLRGCDRHCRRGPRLFAGEHRIKDRADVDGSRRQAARRRPAA